MHDNQNNVNTTHSKSSHSFDTGLAARYGIECAVLINHIRHWVEFNFTMKRNFKEGRTWTYQTYAEIAAHMPYLSYAQVRYAIRKLCAENIIIKGQFNRRKGDNTVWFAFQDEHVFCPNIPRSFPPIPQDLSKLTGVCQNRQGSVKIDRALPDTKKDTVKNKKKREGASTPALTFFDRWGNVKTTQEEHENLVKDFGPKKTEKFYKRLSEWKQDTPKTKWKNSDYRSILRWVVTAVHEDELKRQKSGLSDPSREEQIKKNRDAAEKLFREITFSDPQRCMKVVDVGVEVRTEKDVYITSFTEDTFAEQIINKLKSWGMWE